MSGGCQDPASLTPGHARARAHQGSCLTDAVTSAVEVRLTPVYSPSWAEYFRLLLSGLVLSPGPDITDELACREGESKERLIEQVSFAHTGVCVTAHSHHHRISVQKQGLPSVCPCAILKQKSVTAWAQSLPADGSDVCVWRGGNETVWCAENLEISSWWRRKCACVPLPPTEETQVTTWKMWSGNSGSSSLISPWEKPDTSQFSRSRYGASPGKQISLGSLTLEMLKITPDPSKHQPKPFYPCRTGHLGRCSSNLQWRNAMP